jgi:transcription termination/antitermination protein NusA
MTPEQLEAIEGIGPKTVEKISLAVNNYFSSLEGGELVAEGEAAPAEGAEIQETIQTETSGEEASAAAVEGEALEVAPEVPAGSETGSAETETEEKPAEEHASSEGER